MNHGIQSALTTPRSIGPNADRRTPELLLLEDSPGEAELFWEALLIVRTSLGIKAEKVPIRFSVLQTAGAALTHLTHAAGSSPSQLPILVVVDYDLPGGNGLKFLREVRQDARFRSMPLVVMGLCDEDLATPSAQQFNVSAFILKPSTFVVLVDIVHDLYRRWIFPAADDRPHPSSQSGSEPDLLLSNGTWSEQR